MFKHCDQTGPLCLSLSHFMFWFISLCVRFESLYSLIFLFVSVWVNACLDFASSFSVSLCVSSSLSGFQSLHVLICIILSVPVCLVWVATFFDLYHCVSVPVCLVWVTTFFDLYHCVSAPVCLVWLINACLDLSLCVWYCRCFKLLHAIVWLAFAAYITYDNFENCTTLASLKTSRLLQKFGYVVL